MHFVEQKYKTLIKTKWNRKQKISHTVLQRRPLCFSSYKNCKLKVKLWWVGAYERKKRIFFVPLILSEENFLKIFVLSQCIVYWIHFQNIHTFTYQKTLLHTLFCLFLKLSKAFGVSLIFSTKFNWQGNTLLSTIYFEQIRLSILNLYRRSFNWCF